MYSRPKKKTISIPWKKIAQEIIDKCIDAFKPKLQRVIEVEVWHKERYLLLITQIDTSQYVFVKYGMISIK